MASRVAIVLAALAAVSAGAAELNFDFGSMTLKEPPKGFRSAVLGEGPPAEWKVILDSFPSEFKTLTGQPAANQRPVLAQLSRAAADERYPVLLYEGDTYNDFTFSTRFKCVEGQMEQMAGVVFRAQDEKNFYVLRANAKEGNVRFYKVQGGARSEPLGVSLPISRGTWHELKVECKGNQIRCFCDGTNIVRSAVRDDPAGGAFTDQSFTSGKVGFWTKSDAVSHFVDAKLVYTPKEILAQTIVRETLKKYSRLIGLTLYAVKEGKTEPEVVASSDPKRLGQPGRKAEQDILARGTMYHERGINDITVLMPVHDRNGDVAAVARVTMHTFWGQTEKNAIIRAMPIVKEIEARFHSAKDLLQ